MNVSAPRSVLITGATGFLGKVVLADLIQRREALGLTTLHVLIRPRKGKTAEQRLQEQLLTSPCFRDFPPGWHSCVRAVSGDATQPMLGLEAPLLASLRQELTHVIHCAASVDFNLQPQNYDELALGLVVFTVVGAGFLIHWLVPAIPLAVAFALAAIVALTPMEANWP